MITFLLGLFAGAVVIGFIAHKKPDLFARVVLEVNKLDDKVNAQTQVLKDAVAPKDPQP